MTSRVSVLIIESGSLTINLNAYTKDRMRVGESHQDKRLQLNEIKYFKKLRNLLQKHDRTSDIGANQHGYTNPVMHTLLLVLEFTHLRTKYQARLYRPPF